VNGIPCDQSRNQHFEFFFFLRFAHYKHTAKMTKMPLISPHRNVSPCLFVIIISVSWIEVEGRRRDSDYDMGFETVTDHLWTFLKVGLACSPILIIISMLAFAREDDEVEAAKVEAAKKTKSCKS
jgi:hypothetical protein